MTNGPHEPPPPRSEEQSGSGEPSYGAPGYGGQPTAGQPGYSEPGYQGQQPYGQPGYGTALPEGGGGYGTAPQQGGYGAPPPQGGYAPPPQQSQYGPPPQQGGYAPPPSAGTPYAPPRRERGVGFVALVLTVIGAVAVLLAFLVFRWYRSSADNPVFREANQSKFSQLHKHLDQIQRQLSGDPASKYVHLGVSPDYFSWLGWVLLAAAVVLALIAALPIPGGAVARVLGVLVGLAGLGFTLWALDLIRTSGPVAQQLGSRAPSFTDWIKHTYIGAWLALGGFLVLAIAPAVGSRRKTV